MTVSSSHLVSSSDEMRERKWDYVDIVLVSGDAYVDHPSFGIPLLGRLLESEGFRVAILSQPDWSSANAWRIFGKPRLFFGISAGNLDSMLNHYTANKKPRSQDAYSPGGQAGLRPDRATLVYTQRAKEAYPGTPVVIGGIEASLRRLAHYDYWSDTIKRSILVDSKADLLVFGMGETPIVTIAERLRSGCSVKKIQDVRGTAYVLGAKDLPPEGAVILPAYQEVSCDKEAFCRAYKMIYRETNPFSSKTLVQVHDRRPVVVNPPSLPLTEKELDRLYDLGFSRSPHPRYKQPIPAFEMIKDSVTIMRGCFGGCSFCALSAHQGRIVQSRSADSIKKEIRQIANRKGFKGIISDLGGPTANMYGMGCNNHAAQKDCKKLSCLFPEVCPHLCTNHGTLLSLLDSCRALKGITKILIASGVRMDLAVLDPRYIDALARHHVGGHLKVAPEHASNHVLDVMRKPHIEIFLDFTKRFSQASAKAGLEQYVVPYFMAGHPGSSLKNMVDLAFFLKREGYFPEQVQDFVPFPFTIAACIYHTGRDPLTGKQIYVPKKGKERRLQRALLQYFKRENQHDAREALKLVGDTRRLFGP